MASLATEYGVGWDTVWAAVEHHGRPLVEDRQRVGAVRALGVDEHSYLAATRDHATIFATVLVDLDQRKVIDLFEGKSAAKLRQWSAQRSRNWRRGVSVVALDLTDTYRAGLRPHLSHATRVADPSMSTGSPTAWSTRSAAECRTKHSGIEAARPIRFSECESSPKCHPHVITSRKRPRSATVVVLDPRESRVPATPGAPTRVTSRRGPGPNEFSLVGE